MNAPLLRHPVAARRARKMPGRDGVANRAKAEITMQEITAVALRRKRADDEATESRRPDQIIIGERHRKELGDLIALARSINDRGGLIHPIAITPQNELIAGERRLKAWQLPECRFHDQPIPVTVIDINSIVAGESDENDPALRKAFTLSEAVAIAHTLRPRFETAAKERQRAGGRAKASGKLPEADKGETREKIARAVGKGERTLVKATLIVAAAMMEPDKYGKLVEAMDRTGRVNGPYKRLQNIMASEEIKREPPGLPMNGPYRAGIIDPPWASEPDEADKDHGARGYYPYPTMTPEQIAVLPVPSILHADASVWLWITNFHLLRGDHLTIAKAWGLKPVTLLTWVKRKGGQGQRARGATEHLIQMVRGDVLCLGSDTKTWFDGKGGEHSQKPDEVYAIVERLTPSARYFELFSRGGARDNWDFHGDEVGKHAARTSPPEAVSRIEFLPLEDCAEIRSVDDDYLDIPSFLRRGHPDCVI